MSRLIYSLNAHVASLQVIEKTTTKYDMCINFFSRAIIYILCNFWISKSGQNSLSLSLSLSVSLSLSLSFYTCFLHILHYHRFLNLKQFYHCIFYFRVSAILV